MIKCYAGISQFMCNKIAKTLVSQKKKTNSKNTNTKLNYI